MGRRVSVDGIVLVHGGMCTAASWNPVLPYLDKPALAVNLPGRADRPADLAAVTISDCVRAVLDSADQAGWQRFVLVGHSLGGVTVSETASTHPARVAHLVYVGALVPDEGSSGALTQTGADWPAGLPVTVEQDIARALFGNDLDDAAWAAVWEEFVPDAGGLMNARLSGLPTGVPITYVSLTEDVAVPPALVEQMLAKFGDGVVHQRLPGGHFPMVTRPQALAAIINDAADAA